MPRHVSTNGLSLERTTIYSHYPLWAYKLLVQNDELLENRPTSSVVATANVVR